MPFIEPCVTSKNQARYKTIDCCDDFILQEHRYSLRKSRHLYWVRVITRATKPRFKVAQSFTEKAIRVREWKYICEDLAKGMPDTLALSPPGSRERTQWLLEKLTAVKRQLGDTGEEDEEDEEDEFDDSFQNNDEFGEQEEMKEQDTHTNEQDASARAVSATPTSLINRKQKRRPLSDDYSDRISKLASPVSQQQQSHSKVSKFIRTLRTKTSSSKTDTEPMVPLIPVVDQSILPPIEPDEGFAEQDGVQPRLQLPRWQSDDRSVVSTENGYSSDDMSVTEGYAPVHTTQPNMPWYKSISISSLVWVRSGLCTVGLASAADFIGLPNEQSLISTGHQRELSEALPAYLMVPQTEEAKGKKEREAVTMEKLKREHERKSMAKGVAAVTLLSFVIRMVSFDAFLLLLVGLNVAVCYGVHHRHTLVKKFAKNSIKRRVKFTKQVWNSRWGKSKTPQNGSTPSSSSGLQIDPDSSVAVPPGNKVNAGSTPRRSLHRSVSQPQVVRHQDGELSTQQGRPSPASPALSAQGSSYGTRILKRITSTS